MELQTTITEVVVYPDRARVTREGSVALEAGEHRLAVAGLPLRMDVESLRVAAHGVAGARLVGTEVQRTFFVETPVRPLHDLETQIEATQDALKALAVRRSWLETERAALEATLKAGERFAAGLAFGRLDVEAYFATLQHFTARAEAIQSALVALDGEERALKRRLEKLQQEYRQYAETRPREQYTVWVEVTLPQPGTLTVSLTCIVHGAEWTPLYDLRWRGDGHVDVHYLAQITQNTGEPWPDVTLTLSTARPGHALTIPELAPWPLDVWQPPPPAPAPMLMRAMAMPHPAEDRASLEQASAAPADVVSAEVITRETGVTYRIPARVTIPPDGTARKVTIAHLELETELNYITAPKLEPVVYRRARLVNRSPYLWLPGQAALFWEDEFIGRTALALLPSEAACELATGLEDRIKVERKRILYDVDKRLIGDRRTLRIGYEITLENLLEKPVQVEVRDQIPYARHEQIKVKLENATPTAEPQELGRLRWLLKLAPRAKTTMRFEFSVEHPAALKITGLED